MKMERFTPLANKFTLPPTVTAVTNLTSGEVDSLPEEGAVSLPNCEAVGSRWEAD